MELVPLTAIDKADTAWVMTSAALVLLRAANTTYPRSVRR